MTTRRESPTTSRGIKVYLRAIDSGIGAGRLAGSYVFGDRCRQIKLDAQDSGQVLKV